MITRIITFAGSAVSIECQGDEAVRIVDFLFKDIIPQEGIAPHATFRVTGGDGPTLLSFLEGDIPSYIGGDPAELAEQLLSAVCHQIAMESRGGLLFHAACLSWQGKGVLIPGGIGAGKSTLTAWLLSQGLDYQTDELVYVPIGSDILQAFHRPLHLKHPSRPVLHRVLDFKAHAGEILSGSYSDLVPAALLNPTSRADRPPLGLILFPRYQAEGKFSWQPLSKAQTGLALMECLINARNLPEHGFPETARLAGHTSAYKFFYTRFVQIKKPLDTALLSIAY